MAKELKKIGHNIDLKNFVIHQVMKEQGRRDKECKSVYAKEHDVEFIDTFAISESAVKKQTRGLKSVIKLDKNFHIYIHGNRELIEQGEDRKGKYYKVYYQEEN